VSTVYRGAADVFDCDAFVLAVDEYARRNKHSRRYTATQAEVPISSLLAVMAGRLDPSLYVAVRLAKYAHLSIDGFVR
jgi:hypothetical protein